MKYKKPLRKLLKACISEIIMTTYTTEANDGKEMHCLYTVCTLS